MSQNSEISTELDKDETTSSINPQSRCVPTYKLVGDNIDKNICPSSRDLRSDHQTKSLHYFHVYAIRDRVDLTDLPDKPQLPDPDDTKLESLLPTEDDYTALKRNFAILAARALTAHMSFFSKCGAALPRHIKHDHYEEMKQRSEVVRL